MEKLKERQRAIVFARFAPDATPKTAAEKLGMTVDAVYKSLGRIQSVLLECIEQTIRDSRRNRK